MVDFEKRFTIFQPGRHTLFNLGQLQRFDKKVEGALLEGSPYQGCTGIVRHEEDARITLTGLKCWEDGEANGLRQRVFHQNEIKVRIRGLPEPLIEVPAGLDPVAAAPQVGGQSVTEFYVWINDLHARYGESAHVSINDAGYVACTSVTI
jgi:hypothetical protein